MQQTDAQATVVITLRPREGQEGAYLRWQNEITELARRFDGFDGTEVFRPEPGVQEDWIVIYRFRDAALLASWIDSDERREMIERGEAIIERVDEHIVATPRGESQPVTVVVSRKVKPGRERDFERWQEGILAASRRFPGFIDAELFRPVEGLQSDWVLVFRFANADTLEAWMHSPERAQWLERVEPLVTEVRLQRIGGGLGGWFPSHADHSGEMTMPPAWKQALAVLFALYPTVMLLTLLVTPQMMDLTRALRIFIGNVLSVAFLTWVGMPLVNRMLRPWLMPRTRLATVWGTAALLVSLALMVWGFQLAG